MNDFVIRALSTLQALLIAAISGTILLAASAAFASEDSPFYFDESGKVQQHGYWSPSQSRPSFEELSQRQQEQRRYTNEWSNSEALRKNREMIDSYHAPKSVAPPPSSYDSGEQYLAFPGGGQRPRVCQKAFGTVYCN